MSKVRDRKPLRPLRVAEVPRNAADAALFDRAVTTLSGEEGLAGFAVAWAADIPRTSSASIRTVDQTIGAGPAALAAGEVWTWCGHPPHCAGDSDFTCLLPWLSRDERDKLLRFRFAEDRWSFGAAHAGLRLLLAPLLGCTAKEVRFVTGDKGKPLIDPVHHGSVAAQQFCFNLAHTRGMVAVILSSAAVGIDVEPVRALPDMRQLIADLMAPEALGAFDAASGPDTQTALFFRNWTLSEAYIKATGEGIDQGLSSFAFSQHGSARLIRSTPGWGPEERWTFGMLTDPGRSACAAVRAAA